MRFALGLLAAAAILAPTVLSAAVPAPAPGAACTPSKNGKAVICPVGGPYPLSSVCQPRRKGREMACRTVPPGTILTPTR